MANNEVKARRKLIEVALPLADINDAAAYEKMPGIGPHPRGLHLWWSRKPLAAARAVLFAQLVDDPSALPEHFRTPEEQDQERARLFGILQKLVLWENTTNEEVLEQARAEIRASWQRACADNQGHPRASDLFDPDKPPALHDPFAGGGAIPLEAQRLGLEAHASDLNPVSVLINRAMIEIPPRFAGRRPVNPEARGSRPLADHERSGVSGLAEDIRYYGKWMRDEAQKRIGHLYPKVKITKSMVRERPDLQRYENRELTVIAWLWARTVRSPNPAFSDVDVPLAATFMLSAREGRQAWVEVVVHRPRQRPASSVQRPASSVQRPASSPLPHDESVSNSNQPSYSFRVHVGSPPDAQAARSGTKAGRGSSFRCVMSGAAIPGAYIKAEGREGRIGQRLMAIVADGDRERVYLSPTDDQERVARQAQPEWRPDQELVGKCRDQLPHYGAETFGDLFTERQLVALGALSELIDMARERIYRAAASDGFRDDEVALSEGGAGARAYAEAVSVYLAFAIDRCADFSNTCTQWGPNNQKVMHLFAKQAIVMAWGFAEAAVLHDTVGGFGPASRFIADCTLKLHSRGAGKVDQLDAANSTNSRGMITSTDPPYYDNIGYADLSDFFYVWLRSSLKSVFPSQFATVAAPKSRELVATPYRHGSRDKAEAFFLAGMSQAMVRLAEQEHPAFPTTIYYAFKQSETKRDGGTIRTGWETFLEAVIGAGFRITGTWPVRSEQKYRSVGLGTNALASSIVLVCRSREEKGRLGSRKEYVRALKQELGPALAHLRSGNIAPVDLAQAAIGPGMTTYTSFDRILDASGEPVTVREALDLINETLDEILAEQEGDFDSQTRWAVAWFAQYGFDSGDFGVAETLSKAKNVSVEGLVRAGIVQSRSGRVRLLRPTELTSDWDPTQGSRFAIWTFTHQLIRAHEFGEERAADLLAGAKSRGPEARDLCYRLNALCERNAFAAEAQPYDALVRSWPEISRLASDYEQLPPVQEQSLYAQGR